MISAKINSMGNLISFKKMSNTISRQELIEMGKTARQDRDRLLEEHPELKEFQKKIERCLDNAGSSENRMAVLGIMIEAKLKELRDELSHLSLLMRQYKTPNHASDE
jgi:dsDNA-specific endonuclease/ATPase MutS2